MSWKNRWLTTSFFIFNNSWTNYRNYLTFLVVTLNFVSYSINAINKLTIIFTFWNTDLFKTIASIKHRRCFNILHSKNGNAWLLWLWICYSVALMRSNNPTNGFTRYRPDFSGKDVSFNFICIYHLLFTIGTLIPTMLTSNHKYQTRNSVTLVIYWDDVCISAYTLSSSTLHWTNGCQSEP